MSVHAKRAPVKTAKQTIPFLEAVIQAQREIIRRHDFEPIGNLSFCNLELPDPANPAQSVQKCIDFRKTGPTVAQAKNAYQLLIVGNWQGIPPRVEIATHADGKTFKFCPACQAKCNMCDGKGCAVCRESGCRPTGHENKSWEIHIVGPLGRIANPPCKLCEGRGYEFKSLPVNPLEFSIGAIGKYMVLGPIVRFSIRALPNSQSRGPFVYDVEPDFNGDPLSIFCDSHEAFLIGGMPQKATR